MTATLCSEAEIDAFVRAFYNDIRHDVDLGPIFEAHVGDWDAHLSKLVDFWSSVLRRTARFRGTPMPRHIALPNLEARLFRRWLELFRSTLARQANCAMAERALAMAERIADSLWYGYQLAHDADVIPSELAHS